eukprot:GFKZ01005119.1.p1 GENE.GFKZ01005119.1~~GFKZ01005119.1.p1  ORF type:complete len:1210 (+),score=239.21 GFKZ01005119.1:118-3747(+)
MGTRNPPTPRARPPKTPGRPPSSSRKPRKTPRSHHTGASGETASPKTPRIKRRVSDFATKRPSAKKRRRDIPQEDQDVEQLLRDVPKLVKAESSSQATELKQALKRAMQTFQNDDSGSDSTAGNAEHTEPAQSDRSHEKSTKKAIRPEIRGEGSSKRQKGVFQTPGKDAQQAGRKSRRTSENFVTPAKPPLPRSRKLDLSAKRACLQDSSVQKARRKSVTASAHKRDIEALKQDDPEFYKFLEEHDASLLDFDLEDELLGLSGEEDEERNESDTERAEDEKDQGLKVLEIKNKQQRGERKAARSSLAANARKQPGEVQGSKSEKKDDVARETDTESESYSDDSQVPEQQKSPQESAQVDGETSEEDTVPKVNSGTDVSPKKNGVKDILPEKTCHTDESDGEESEEEAEGTTKEGIESVKDREETVKDSAVTVTEGKKAIPNRTPAIEVAAEIADEASGSDSRFEEKAKGDVENTPIADSDRNDVEAIEPNSDSSQSHDQSDDGEEDDDEEERREEMLAAAEAGLALEDDPMEVDSEDDMEPQNDDTPSDRKKKKSVIVDTAFLRSLKEGISRKRTCLKATKELLKLLRAGREILPSQADTPDKKAKMIKKKSKGRYSDGKLPEDPADVEKDEFADDGSFTSGNVKFVSSSAYQNGMNLAIVGIQDALDLMLGRPQSRKGRPSGDQLTKWDPSNNVRWPNLQPVFRPYVFHMLALCNAMNDPDTLRFLLKRLERLVPYTRDNELLLKKIIKTAIRVWSSESQYMSEATRLRAYILLNRVAHAPGNAEAVLRSCCTVFATDIATACNSKTLPRIHFAITCIVELFGIDMGASYTTAFANLRELAVSLRAVLVSKEESTDIERIHNWAYINQLRLWSKVLSRYGSEDELRPLIYPYVQVALGVMRVHATPRTFPLRLHVASFLSDVVSSTGTFIPLAPHLLLLLRCSELRKKPERGATKALDWRSMLRVSADVIKTKPFLSGIIDGVVLELAKFFATISKHVSFPELSYIAQSNLRKFAKEVLVSEWKAKVLMLVEKLHQTSQLIEKARAKADFAPHGAASPDGMLAVVPGIDRDMKTPIQRFYEVEIKRVTKEERRRDERTSDERKESRKGDTSNGPAKVRFADHDARPAFRGTSAGDSENGRSDSDNDSGPIDLEQVTRGFSKGKAGGSGRNKSNATKPSLSVPKMVDEGDENDMVKDLVIDSDDSSDDE